MPHTTALKPRSSSMKTGSPHTVDAYQSSTPTRHSAHTRMQSLPNGRRTSSSVPPPSTQKRREAPSSVHNVQSSQMRPRTNHPPSVQIHYLPKTTEDTNSDVASVSSAPTAATPDRERREQASELSRDSSLRDDSPRRKPSFSSGSGKGKVTKLKSERLFSIRKAIEEMNKNLNNDKRKAKLLQACVEFDHWDSTRHDAELHYGAANVLALALTVTTNDDELRVICAALEMVFRASEMGVHAAFEKMGVSCIPWLLQILKRAEGNNLKHADATILNISKIFFYWSRIPEARMPLMRHPGMMDMLSGVANLVNPDAKAFRMRLISNVANSDQNKTLVVENQKLLHSILRVAVVDTNDKTKEYASTTLMDLASCPENQVAMANSDRVLGALFKLAVTEPIAETREAAISGLQNLAYCQVNRVRLVTYSDGVVLDALRKTISTDLNERARRRAAGALTNMACDETAEFMGNHKGLLETLAVVSTKDENSDVQSRAAMALSKIACGINSNMSCYRTLLDALVVASLSHASNSVTQVLRIKAREPENRQSMVRHPGILDTLSDISISPDYPVKDRENSMRALMHLTNEDANHKIMCQKTVLNALVLGASMEGPKWNDLGESAVVALERLATDHSNRPIMGRHPGLLAAVAKVTEREQKLEDAGVQATHERLAKPLLMSLLLAL